MMKYVDAGISPYKKEEKTRKKKLIKFSIAAVLLGIVLYGGYLFYWPISQLINEIMHHPGVVFSFLKDPVADLKSTDGRTNMVLLGIDKRAYAPYSYKDSQGNVTKNGFLTDTIIVLSVGKDSKDAVMISIPRDMWVDIPKWDSFLGGAGKINSVYSIGDTQSYPDGGLALIKKVVSEKLDIPIHYALRIDFEGFKKTINTLDGVEVVVDRAFDDYRYPVEGRENAGCSGGSFSCRFEHVHFEAGSQEMNGEKALQFVRSRTGTNGEGNDFARASRQQKILVAARKKALSLGNFLNPSKVNSLFKDFGESVETDFSLNLYPAAYQLLKEVDASSTKKLVLDSSAEGLLYTPNPAQYGGAYVLLPKGNSWDKVHNKVRALLFPTSGNKQ